jgi:2-methylisocitrate lyase-like PEP mutase family enzyme
LKSQAEKAEEFRAMHHGKKILILPNAWDVPSARVFEDAGFGAVATSSAGVMVSLGYPDGEIIGIDEYVSAIRRMSRVLGVPLSADVVGGFGSEPDAVAASVKKVVEAGAIGINIEDFVHETKKLLTLEEQLARLKAVKALRESMEVPFVVNARTDAFRFAQGDEKERLQEAIRRGVAFRDLGVDCLYPMGLTDPASISTYVEALKFPVNVMVRKGLPPVPGLQRLGVARVSFGPSASYATMGLLKRASQEVLSTGTYETLVDGAISFDELNALAVPKKTA